VPVAPVSSKAHFVSRFGLDVVERDLDALDELYSAETF
jgi:hypothetical protein